jgi:hypothetical protein
MLMLEKIFDSNNASESNVHQPMGLCTAVPRWPWESVGSAASFLFINPELSEVRGIEISANHLKAKRNG